MYKSDELMKQADVMTQITYSFKKLDIKDSRKKVEKSLKNRRIVQKMDSMKNLSDRSISRDRYSTDDKSDE